MLGIKTLDIVKSDGYYKKLEQTMSISIRLPTLLFSSSTLWQLSRSYEAYSPTPGLVVIQSKSKRRQSQIPN